MYFGLNESFRSTKRRGDSSPFFVFKICDLVFCEVFYFLVASVIILLKHFDDRKGGIVLTEQLLKSKAADLFHTQLTQLPNNAGYRYLKYTRKLTDEIIEQFKLGFSPWNGTDYSSLNFTDSELAESGLLIIKDNGFAFDRFYNRVLFPIWNEQGTVIAFGGRWLGQKDARPKYINTKETPLYKKSKVLYGLNFAIQSSFDSFILCEGYMDVISLHQAGFTNAIAACGTSITNDHISLLKRLGRKVYVATDSDSAGNLAALKTVKKLMTEGIYTRRLDFSPYKDVDEALCAGANMLQIIQNSESPERFLFRAGGQDIEILKWLLERKMSDLDI